MRLLWCVLVGVGVLGGCADDDPDTVAPDTVLDEAPAALTNQARVRFVFHATTDANTFYCQLDDAPIVECAPPFEAEVTEGPHTFSVAAALNQEVDETPAMHTWSVDGTAPETTIVSGPPALDNSLTPVFELAGEDPGGGAVTFECSLDGDPFTACTSPANLIVVDGAHVYAVRAKDAAGNVDPTPAEHTWTIDATAPETLITMGPAANATTGNDVQFAFVSPDAEATFECKLDQAAYAPCTSPRVFTNLGEGPHTFTVRARDASAVDPSPASRTWIVDGTSPDVMITATPPNPSNDPTPTFGFSSSDATATFECQVDNVVAFTACSSPWTAPAVGEGTRTFRVRATDGVGNVSAAQTYTWLVDLTPPDTTIVTGEPSPSGDLTGDFTFAASPAAGATFECSVDGGAFTPCTTPFATAPLGNGEHTFEVRATDAAGNTDPTPATRTWTIDASPPDTTIVVAPPDPTNDPTSAFAFTASEPGTFQCSIDGGTFVACAANFTTPPLGQGVHTLEVRAVDSVGNVDPTPASHTWTVDSQPPDTTIATAPASPTNDPTGAFTFTSNDAGATFQCDVDASGFVPCAPSFTTAALADGSHTLRVRAVDSAGNVDPTADTHTWVVDTAAPNTTITSAEPDPSADTTGDFAFASSQAGSTFECRVDGGAFVACTSPFTTATLANGMHAFEVRATDPAGNTDPSPDTHAWTVDAQPPETTIATTPTDPTRDATGTFTFTSDEPGTFQCAIDGAAFAACPSPFTTSALVDGAHTLQVRARDTLGTLDPTPASYTWTIDTTPPDTTITDQPTHPTADSTGTFDFVASPAAGASFECSLDGGAFAPCSAPSTTAPLADGSHTFRVRALDALGNVDASPDAFTWTVDTQAPDTVITNAPASLANDPTASFTFAASPAGGTTFECSLDTAAFAACPASFTTPALADGVHVLEVRALDALDNADPTPASHTWTVDTQPAETTITAQPPDPSSDPTGTFEFTASQADATFQCRIDAGAFAACTSPLTTAALADGAHTFAVRATDPAGNIDASPATATWTVDTTPPVVAIAPVASPLADNTPTIAFTVTGGATVRCQVDGNAPVACTSPFTTSTLVEGSHTVTIVADDQAGNTDTAQVTMIIDTTPPTVTITKGGGLGIAEAQRFAFASSADAQLVQCRVDTDAFAPCTSPFDASTIEPGAHVLDVRVADAAGNERIASRAFELDPIVQCLDGADNRGDDDVSGLVEELAAATVEFWFRGNANGDMHLVDFDIPALYPNVPVVSVRFQDGAFRVAVDARHNLAQNGSLNQTAFALPAQFARTSWHHYAVVFGSATPRVFVDGVELTNVTVLEGDPRATFVNAFGGYAIPIEMHVGYFARDNVRYAAGAFRDLRVSDMARYSTKFLPPYPTLEDGDTLLMYPMDEGGGDSSSEMMARTQGVAWAAPSWGVCRALVDTL